MMTRSTTAAAALVAVAALAKQGLAQVCDASMGTVAILSEDTVSSDCEGKADGETCTAECATGYEASSADVTSTSFTCTTDTFVKNGGQGDLDCVASACSAASYPSGDHVTHDCQDKRTTETCEAACEAGFEGTAQTFTCEASGDFAGTAVTCKGPCDDSMASVAILQNSSVNSTACMWTLADAECTATCATGYEAPVDGAQSTAFTCTSNTFVKKTGEGDLVCSPKVCMNPPSGTGLNSSACIGKTHGEMCDITCAEGFMGSAISVTCNHGEEFTMTSALPTCTATSMGDFTTPVPGPACDKTGYSDAEAWFDEIKEHVDTLTEMDDADAARAKAITDFMPTLKGKICEHKVALEEISQNSPCDVITMLAVSMLSQDSACLCGGMCEQMWGYYFAEMASSSDASEEAEDADPFANPSAGLCRFANCYVTEACTATGDTEAMMDNLTAMVSSECGSYLSAGVDGAELTQKPFAPFIAAISAVLMALPLN